MANLEIPDDPIVYADGRPLPWFIILLKRVNATVNGILQFVDLNTGVIVTADQISQGITQRVREIAKQELEYNADGTVSKIEYKDPATDALLAQEDFSYNADASIAQVVEKTPQATVTENFTYTGPSITEIDAVVGEAQIGLF